MIGLSFPSQPKMGLKKQTPNVHFRLAKLPDERAPDQCAVRLLPKGVPAGSVAFDPGTSTDPLNGEFAFNHQATAVVLNAHLFDS